MPEAHLRRLQIELINRCNLRCPLCRTLWNDEVRRGRMELPELRRLLKPVAPQLEAVTLHGTRGEPFLHPHFEVLAAEVKTSTHAFIDVSTNGTLVTERRAKAALDAGIDRVVFAVDGLSEESYQQYRVGGSLRLVLANLGRLCELKRAGGYRTKIVLQLIPMASNEHELDGLPQLGEQLGVDEVRIKISASVTRDRARRPKSSALRAAVSTADWTCPSGVDKLYVDPNGDCFPCCYAEGNVSMSLGNALSTPIDALYTSTLARQIRSAFARSTDHHPFCVDRCANRPVARKRRLRLAPTRQLAVH